jgi:hypothetical protein
MTTSPRYAVYWVPDRRHPLWTAGCTWLGRDPEDGSDRGAPHAHVDAPRRYGFHATVRAPIRLAAGVDEAAFLDRVREIAHGIASFDMPSLEVAVLHDFIALRPRIAIDATHPARRLGDAFTTGLEACRRPLSEEEIEERLRKSPADAQAVDHVRRHGYAFVLDRWRLHLTLSDSFADDVAGQTACEQTMARARRHFAAALAQPLSCHAVSVFVEDLPGRPFRLKQRVGLGA